MDRQQWFEGKTWGLFFHFLAAEPGNAVERPITISEWNEQVDRFDAEWLAEQLARIGVDYFGITIGQNSGFYCAPNPVYDAITGLRPSKCSQRDLIADLADALQRRGIDLWAYLPSGAPCADPEAARALEWEDGVDAAGNPTGKRLAPFQQKWEAVIREWSLRWGRRVKGWWIDGCYYQQAMYAHPSAPNYESLAAAIRAGNPDAVLCLNPGIQAPFHLSGVEDFTAGESDKELHLAVDGAATGKEIRKKLGGRKLHVLSYLGDWWGRGEPRFPVELAAGYTRYVRERGGIVTWDVPVGPGGSVPAEYESYLAKMNAMIRK